MTVSPGLRIPSFSASSTILTPILSLTEPPALKNSHFATGRKEGGREGGREEGRRRVRKRGAGGREKGRDKERGEERRGEERRGEERRGEERRGEERENKWYIKFTADVMSHT